MLNKYFEYYVVPTPLCMHSNWRNLRNTYPVWPKCCIMWSTYWFSRQEFTTWASNSVCFTVFQMPLCFTLWNLNQDDTQWWEPLYIHYQYTSSAWPGCYWWRSQTLRRTTCLLTNPIYRQSYFYSVRTSPGNCIWVTCEWQLTSSWQGGERLDNSKWWIS